MLQQWARISISRYLEYHASVVGKMLCCFTASHLTFEDGTALIWRNWQNVYHIFMRDICYPFTAPTFTKVHIDQSISQISIVPIPPEQVGSVAQQRNQCSTAKSKKQFRNIDGPSIGHASVYGGKAISKRCVFRCFLKVTTEMAEWTDSRRLLQRDGAQEWKALAPVLVLTTGTDSITFLQSQWVGWEWCGKHGVEVNRLFFMQDFVGQQIDLTNGGIEAEEHCE